jgi:hypothetical protein
MFANAAFTFGEESIVSAAARSSASDDVAFCANATEVRIKKKKVTTCAADFMEIT